MSGVQQSGTVTPGHIVTWAANGVVQDGGTTAPSAAQGINVVQSGSVTPGHVAVFGANGVIEDGGTVPPDAGPVGPAIEQSGIITPGHIATWTTIGVLQDGGAPETVGITQQGSVVGGHIAVWASPWVIEDGGPALVQNGSVLSGHMAVWESSGTLADGGQPLAQSGTSTPGELAVWDSTGTLANAGSGLIGGTQGITVEPTGNPLTTLTSFNVQGTAVSATTREYLVDIGMTTGVASGGSPNGGDVALYAGLVMESGSALGWSYNTVLTMNSGADPSSAIGYELDFNNNAGDRGDTAGAGGLSAPVAYGLAITGSGSFKSTAALLISGPGSAIWNRGIVFGNASVAQSCYQDLGQSTISVEVQGNHTYALDTGNSVNTGGGALRLPLGANGLIANNVTPGGTSTGFYGMVSLTTGPDLILGADITAAANQVRNVIFANTGGVSPESDNSLPFGSSTARWTAVWAVNGTIQTSDPAQKTAIQPVPAIGATIVKSVGPITFGWAINTDPMFDGTDQWGFDASQVAAAFLSAKAGFGGVVKDKDGALHISTLQMLAVLWQHCRELEGRVAELESARMGTS
jgi:hypothetical protein